MNKPVTRKRLLPAIGLLRGVALGLLSIALFATSATQAEAPQEDSPRLQPLPITPAFVELAPYMGEMQTLTHKLSLSIEASNPKLARFYAYELKVILETTQNEVPEYDGQPIALLIERITLPVVDDLASALARDDAAQKELADGLDSVIDSCNECHTATLHEFIKITRGSGVNPFAQDFTP